MSAVIPRATSTSPRSSDVDTEGIRVPYRWRSARGVWRNLVFLWRTSLPFRTIALSVALTTATVLSVGFVMSNSIASDLFNSRLRPLVSETERAVTAAQTVFASGEETDSAALETLQTVAVDAAQDSAANSYGVIFMQSGSGTGEQSNELRALAKGPVSADLVSDELKEAVSAGADTTATGAASTSPQTHYQSIALVDELGNVVPGIVIGSTVTVQNLGQYEMYFVYSMEETQQTLDFVQRTLVVAMIVLVLLVAVITGFVMRAVIQPIREAAKTSRRLAAGHLEQRVPESGEDDIATLARSFNEMADSLQDQIERLANLSQVQQRFVSDVSHELRTPLTTIRLAGGMLFDRRDDFDTVTARSVELLHDQIERFEILLADLLEISRYDAGAVEILRESNSLATVADDVIGAMTPVALDHGTRLVLKAPGGYGESEFDARRINRVVRNLLGNAIEHGEAKPIVVSVDSNESAVALSVRDYGIGMTEAERTRVFDRFWRADPSRKRTMGGSGLGLAISLEDVRLHEGRLEVWSEPGKGTNFRLTLPRFVGGKIMGSPLPLEPGDAGAATITIEQEDVSSEAFTDEDVDTQPIELPDLVGMRSSNAEPIVSSAPTNSMDVIETASLDEPTQAPAPWDDAEAVVVTSSAPDSVPSLPSSDHDDGLDSGNAGASRDQDQEDPK
ncbi:MtrAB system histidine kinase MtrB [Pseudoclavibacter sp. RFBB5]|uniref:MtrAB system histidine kinase MtrB n=2 Tax=Pseudoclavibacter TaxID=255204 RepID=UPI002158811A|nr:MtrAB system histidine kinase MtrB [Pseudoclavibacter sp. RFBB5]